MNEEELIKQTINYITDDVKNKDFLFYEEENEWEDYLKLVFKEVKKEINKKYLEAVSNYENEKHKNTKAIEYIKNSWNSKNTTPIENYSVGSWEIDILNILSGRIK